MTDLIPTLLFYLFSAAVLCSGAMVIASRNPVHSVFFLIFAFFNAAGLFLLLGAEYLAMTLVIVYVGAVAVLFLFVVMMLNINFAELREGFLPYLKLGLGIAGLIFAELAFVFYISLTSPQAIAPVANAAPDASEVTNTHALGQILYTDYLYPFQIAGLILLVAMIGAITLTLRHRPGVRRQRIARQVARTKAQGVEVVKVGSGQGV